MTTLQLKVCGMRDPANVRAVNGLRPDYIGFIFYPESPRFVGDQVPATKGTRRVGVFVNSDVDQVVKKVHDHALDYVQLHGQESLEQCFEITRNNIKVIKAFSVDDEFNFSLTDGYSDVCDYFLFDTRGVYPGGNSRRFNWSVLERYRGPRRFFLSGGIGLADIQDVKKVSHPMLMAIDINSKVELSAGVKDIEAIRKIQLELTAI